jgi:hypothetical protein
MRTTSSRAFGELVARALHGRTMRSRLIRLSFTVPPGLSATARARARANNVVSANNLHPVELVRNALADSARTAMARIVLW